MDLYLVRHAIAEDQSAGGDEDRALTEAGKTKMIRATEGLRKLKIAPDLILTSPLRRARETAEILAHGLNEAKIDVMRELGTASQVSTVIPALRPHSRLESLMLVGHQPSLGHLASILLTGSESTLFVDFKKGGVACIEAAVLDDNPRGVLRWLATPRLLRSI